jgi:hypothetical protein
MTMNVTKQTNTMRAWVQRREEAHKSWTQDELWNRIKQNWPMMPETDQERVFQGAVTR